MKKATADQAASALLKRESYGRKLKKMIGRGRINKRARKGR